MKRRIAVAAGCLFAVSVAAADDATPIPREGKISTTQVSSGSFQVFRLGKDRFRGSYDVMGVHVSENTADLFHNASFRCVGAMNMVDGSFDDETGSCVLTRLDGDQAFTVYKATGKVGTAAKGTITYVGGSGKLAGLTGSAEFSRYSVRPAAEGTAQTVTRVTGTYKLPAAAAAR